MKRDNLHYSSNKIMGYQKPFNFVISEREAGKSTDIWNKCFGLFKKGKTVLVIRRQITDITEVYVSSIQKTINKFNDEPITFRYKKGTFREGVADIYIGKRLFIRIIALSNPMSRIKSLVLEDIGLLVFDEFICNTRMKEKYIEGEFFKFEELYTTFRREAEGVLVCYFAGNPYSKYNPYFSGLSVDYSKIKQGCVLVGEEYAIECYQITEELKAEILKNNPLYKFDESYKKYAFDGISVNDLNILVEPKQPQDFYLSLMFVKDGKYYGVYENIDFDCENLYWVGIIKNPEGKRRKIYAFQFADLVNKTALFTNLDKARFQRFKQAIGMRFVTYQNIECSYVCEEIYTSL